MLDPRASLLESVRGLAGELLPVSPTAALILAGIAGTAPVVVALLGRVRRHVPRARPLVDLFAVVLLWITFDASFAAVWGATLAVRARFDLSFLLEMALLAQPLVPWLCYLLVVRPGPSAALPRRPAAVR